MTYLTCSKHRSFQRKHIDVCRQCPDNDECDAFQEFVATEPPPPPPPEPAAVNLPIRLLLAELGDIRELVADTPALPKSDPLQNRKKSLKGTELVDILRLELEEIRKLC